MALIFFPLLKVSLLYDLIRSRGFKKSNPFIWVNGKVHFMLMETAILARSQIKKKQVNNGITEW